MHVVQSARVMNCTRSFKLGLTTARGRFRNTARLPTGIIISSQLMSSCWERISDMERVENILMWVGGISGKY